MKTSLRASNDVQQLDIAEFNNYWSLLFGSNSFKSSIGYWEDQMEESRFEIHKWNEVKIIPHIFIRKYAKS